MPKAQAVRNDPDDPYIDRLAASIKADGLLQPIVIRPAEDGYELVAGHRRLLAHHRLAAVEIPATVIHCEPQDIAELALCENLQRHQMSPIEEASAIADVLQEPDVDPHRLAARLGRSPSWISRRLSLLSMPDELQAAVHDGHISPGAADAIQQIPDEQVRIDRTRDAVLYGCSVRTARAWAQQYAQASRPQLAEPAPPPEPATEPTGDIMGQCPGCMGPLHASSARIIQTCPDCHARLLDIFDGKTP